MKEHNVVIRVATTGIYQVLADTKEEACKAAEFLMMAELNSVDEGIEFEVMDRIIDPQATACDTYEARKVIEAEEKGGYWKVYNDIILGHGDGGQRDVKEFLFDIQGD